MDLERMREFVAFSKSLNFTAAARELHLSQPSLSKHVHDLERELGAGLVRRGVTGAGNCLTPAGVRFVELAGDVLRRYDALVAECRRLQDAVPPARIQDVRHGFNVVGQLHALLRDRGVCNVGFSYVKTDLPICDALDRGEIDFAVHLEPAPAMAVFAYGDLRDLYGWIPLKPERVCFLAGRGNPLFGESAVSLATLSSCSVFSGGSPAYESWYSAMPAIFMAHGCLLELDALPDAPLDGGAYPIGPDRLCLCTERFAAYYVDLGVETVDVLQVADFDPFVYPFLVYRRDCASPAARRIVACLQEEGGGGRREPCCHGVARGGPETGGGTARREWGEG